MQESYLTLFFATGSPVFYLLYRREPVPEEQAKTAWRASQAELV